MAIYTRDKTTGDLDLMAGTTRTFTGATSTSAGKEGMVPQPTAGDQSAYLRGDGTWDNSINTRIAKCEVLVLSASGISALPYTFSNVAIETDMVCINSVLSNPSAQLNDWTVNTDTAGSCVVSGTISGSTDLTLYLMKSQ